MNFSFIIPVFNRPNETNELLESLTLQSDLDFEVVVIEDGSTVCSEDVVRSFQSQLNCKYLFKENTGPGDSRNYGMKKASGDYFIILDSDCILPKEYFKNVKKALKDDHVDCFGGPDKALDSFSTVQKAINYAMTSFLTTGGLRGGSEKLEKFQPRSFNMGLSKKAFEISKGFGKIHPGEDPDLSIRLWKAGFRTKLFKQAFVYHKRRVDWNKFYNQVYKFGKARPILDFWHPEYSKITFWFPTLFLIGIIGVITLSFLHIFIPALVLLAYFVILFMHSSIKNKNVLVGILSLVATLIQFYGYGKGFLISWLQIKLMKQEPKKAFPELFFE
ncbi:glycosyltransferase [uncultured Flavobacterium sp.]|uniref:glycosyltransferase n=1 Tax=uncultured Flavobacterium sp. TaxID=165435 RepID=UPI0030CA4B26